MNEEQKRDLQRIVSDLLNAQADVSYWGLGDDKAPITEANNRRTKLNSDLVAFVESITTATPANDDPLFGTLIYDDPRAGLRKCVVNIDREEYFVHREYIDDTGLPCVMLECENGTTETAEWRSIQYVDVPDEAAE